MLFSNLFAAVTLGFSALTAVSTRDVTLNERALTRKISCMEDYQHTQQTLVHYQPVFESACKSGKNDELIRGLVDIHGLFVHLSDEVKVAGLVQVDLKAIVDLHLNVLVQLQAVLHILSIHAKIDACKSNIIALAAPLKILVGVFVNAGIDVNAMIAAHVGIDVSFFASIGVDVRAAVKVHAGVAGVAL